MSQSVSEEVRKTPCPVNDPFNANGVILDTVQDEVISVHGHSQAWCYVCPFGKRGRRFRDLLTALLYLSNEGKRPFGVIAGNVVADLFKVFGGLG